jgi:adenine-specific DNA-methyltransferase
MLRCNTKNQSIIEEKVYRDTWGQGLDSYLKMMQERLTILRDLLSPIGSIYVHLDWHIGHYVKLLLDEIFGRENFINEITWHYYNKFAPVSKCFPRASDRIISYANVFGEHIFNKQEEKRDKPIKQLKRKFINGKAINVRDEEGNVEYQIKTTKRVDDVWRISMLQPADKTEYTGFRTQKPERLLQRIIKASSEQNSIVADFFCGSGTTLTVAEKLGRRWIGCDLGRYAIHTTRKRLMDIENCEPFEILNLGQYERQVWQGVTFAGAKQTQQMLIFEYLKFILELYDAQPLAGAQHLHGKKGNAVVHVGAVDAPVTIDEIIACVGECKTMQQKELHVLGWEWEMGLANILVDEAKAQGVKLLLLNIPREVMEQQAVDRGDIHFYELAYLETDIQVEGHKVTVELTDFIIPNDELIPAEVRQKIKKWSDYVDYWAVDWDFQNDTFVNQWTSYRTRRDRSLKLKTEPHEYPEAGKYLVLVKVIDIFGNDTSQVFEVSV